MRLIRFSGQLLVFLFLTGASWNALAQALPQCVLGTQVPCAVEWYRFSPVPARTESYGYDTAILTSQDVITAATSRSTEYTDRDVFRFRPDGTPVDGYGIPGVPWYIGASSGADWRDIPWQKIVVDEARSRFFVFYAANAAGGLSNDFFLAAHSLTTGQKLAAWGETSRVVGSSSDLNAFIDIDGNGNVWTIWQEGTVLFLKKWDGSTGANISPSNFSPPRDYSIITSPAGYPRRYQGFGVRKSDNKLFIAFEESPHDAVITVWSESLQFLSRHNYAKVVNPPPSIPAPEDCCGWGQMEDHPYFSDGFVNEQGSFFLTGSYRFERRSGEFDMYFAFPVVLRFGIDAAGTAVVPGPEYYEDQHYLNFVTYDMPERLAVRAIGTATGGTYLRFVDRGRVLYFIDNVPSYRAHVSLPMPFTGSMGEPGCRYLAFADVNGMRVTGGRLVVTGTVKKLLNPCGNEEPLAYTVSYQRTFSFKCCLGNRFDWEFRRFEAFWRNWKSPWTPPPVPCPRCGIPPKRAEMHAAEVVREAFIRDIGLIASSRPAEFPNPVLKRVADGFAALQVGPLFTEQRRVALVKQLTSATRDGRISPELRVSLLENTNAALVDRLARTPLKAMISNENRRAALGHVSVRYPDASRGMIELQLRNGLPAFVDGLEPIFPMTTVHLASTAKAPQGKPIEVHFDLSRFTFPSDAAGLHVLRWDGKAYRDITTAFNIDDRTVSARTAELGDFVVMSSRATTGGTRDPKR